MRLCGSHVERGGAVARSTPYRLFTAALAAWLLAGGLFDVSRSPGALAILRTLGYPAYLCPVLGVAKLLAIAALLYPRSRLLREWAYAGVTFDGLGALISHLAVRDGLVSTCAPAVFLVVAALSYVLRPGICRPGAQPSAATAALEKDVKPAQAG